MSAMDGEFAKVHLLTTEGHTFSFLNVSNFSTNESVVAFTFTAQSDGQVKNALFFVRNLAGYTTLVHP